MMRRRLFSRASIPPRRRGMLMIELIAALVIMAVASALAGEMFVMGLKVMRQTADRDTLIGRVDSAVDKLRRDAWAADAVTLPAATGPEAPSSVEFHLPTGTVTWRAQGTTLTRTDADGKRTWTGVTAFDFSKGTNGVVTLTVATGPGDTGPREHLSLLSPRLGGQP